MLAAAAALGGGLWWYMTRNEADMGGLYAPQYQPPADDDLARLTHPDGYHHLCQPHQHHAGYVYTPHRYPRTVGGEITNAIHRGFSSMRVPAVQDYQWIIAPPSEVMW